MRMTTFPRTRNRARRASDTPAAHTLLVALGLVIFGVYGLGEARWRGV